MIRRFGLSYTQTLRWGIAALLSLIAVVVLISVHITTNASVVIGHDLEARHRKERLFVAIADEFASGGAEFLVNVSVGKREEEQVLTHLESIRGLLAELQRMELSDAEQEQCQVLAREERRFRTAAYGFWVNQATDETHDYGVRAMEEVQNAIVGSINRAKYFRDITDSATRSKHLSLRESLDKSAAILMTGGILAILAGGAVAIYLSRGLTRPIRSILDATEALASGDLSHRLNWSNKDQLGQLAYGIDAMADRIASATRQLEEARKRAEDASHAKSQFLANMSHEIRTPMTAILGFAEQLTDPDLSVKDRSEATNTIVRNGKHLLDIINDILDLSKIEAGKMTIEMLPCSPRRLIDDLIALMRVRTEAKGVELILKYETPIPATITTDQIRFRQILINLLGNAVKFTEVGSVTLSVRCITDQGDPHLRLDLVDTGMGMSEEQVKTLFQPFVQADNSLTRRFGGTGLGLAISRRFAQMLGGDIEIISSKQWYGTHVRTTIDTGPLDGIDMVVTTATNQPESIEQHRPAPSTETLAKRRILLAEDGPDNQRLITFILRKAGAIVSLADNGEDAVDQAMAALMDGTPFDALLMDMQMPIMDGYEATSVLRRKGYSQPIIALTAHAMAGDRKRCLDAGCDDYATKPVDRETLLSIICDHISRQQSDPPSHSNPPTSRPNHADNSSGKQTD